MAFAFASGMNLDTGAGTNHVKLLASLPAGATLHEVNVQGKCFNGDISFTATTGTYATKNLAAGLQYGAVGHVPSGITDGTATGENWLAFAQGLPTLEVINTTVNAAGATLYQSAAFGIDFTWRGLFNFSGGADLHFECGENGAGGGTFNFKLDYTWWVGYST